MNNENIKEILYIILDHLQDKKVTWRLEGSANLKIQNVETKVNDLDITTNDEGIGIFRDVMKEFIVKDFFSEKINGISLVCNIIGFEVEINSYGNRELNMFDRTRIIFWNGIKIPILPLEYAKKFYESINRKDKVDLILRYIS